LKTAFYRPSAWTSLSEAPLATALHSADASHQDHLFAALGAPAAPTGVPVDAWEPPVAQDFVPTAPEATAALEIPEAQTADNGDLGQCHQCHRQLPLTVLVELSEQLATTTCHDCCVAADPAGPETQIVGLLA
jgi:hypothetical protein